MDLGGAVLTALGILVGILALVFRDASFRSRALLGFACFVLLLVGVILLMVQKHQEPSASAGPPPTVAASPVGRGAEVRSCMA